MKHNQGFIQIIIILLLVVVILSLLGVKLVDIFGNETLRNNFAYITGAVKPIWDKYIKGPLTTAIQFIWNIFRGNASNIWEKLTTDSKDFSHFFLG